MHGWVIRNTKSETLNPKSETLNSTPDTRHSRTEIDARHSFEPVAGAGRRGALMRALGCRLGCPPIRGDAWSSAGASVSPCCRSGGALRMDSTGTPSGVGMKMESPGSARAAGTSWRKLLALWADAACRLRRSLSVARASICDRDRLPAGAVRPSKTVLDLCLPFNGP